MTAPGAITCGRAITQGGFATSSRMMSSRRKHPPSKPMTASMQKLSRKHISEAVTRRYTAPASAEKA